MFRAFLLTCILASALKAEPINPPPFDYINVQFAGNIGLLSVGGGNTFLDGHYEMEFYLGLTPHTHSEAAILTVAMKNNLIPFTLHVSEYALKPYVGLGLLSALNHRYDPQWRDELPDDYYYQDIWHLTAHLGLVAQYGTWGLYFEAMTVDSYFAAYASSNGAITPDDIISFAVGLRRAF